MARRSILLFCSTLSVCLTAAAARAQDFPAAAPPSADPPAHVAFVEGAAILERDGQAERDPSSMPLLAGDRLRTDNGRVEVLFADGSLLHMDARTVVDFQSDQVVRLLEGRIRLSIAGAPREVGYRIDAPSAWVQIATPGEYRIAVSGGGDVELAVLRGSAELVNEEGRSFIAAGERTFARAGSAPSPPYVFNSAAWDDFDRWSEARRDLRLGASAQYLPPDVRPYSAAFDAYGSWRYEQTYGYVWYPRVAAGWRPYSHGRWVSLRPYGWTWIARDPWGWPTHHYGRWGISAGAWFWIPGRQWGPAWVSWAYATDYVSWCPLGWNNRPVLQIVNINVYRGRRYSPWDAWTVIPRRHFDAAYVNVGRIAPVRVAPRVRDTFVVRDTAPAVRYAIGRDTPIRSAGHFAIPRPGTGPAYGGSPGGSRVTTGDPRSSDRAFPAPARAPRTPSAAAAPPTTAGPGGRAVARDRAPGTAAGAPPAPADRDAGASPRPSRRGDAPALRGSAQPAPVTPAPDGAVRAIPRNRPSPNPGTGALERGRTGQDRPPASVAPAPAAPRGAEVDPYRPAPRRLPQSGAEYRGRAVPRPGSAGGDSPVSAQPSPVRPAPAPRGGVESEYGRSPYRSAGDERQAGPSRRPSGDAARTGTARRRR
jgi:hypothetical protein